MIKAVIFDLDGVLVHTDNYHYLAWKSIADTLGLSFDESINNQLRGVSRMESFEIILKHNGVGMTDQEKEQHTRDKNEVYKKYLLEMNTDSVDSSVVDALKTLKAQGIKIAIGSSSRNARLILERIGIIGMFDAISDGNNIVNSKPDPEVFLKAAQMLQLEPAVCLVIEDAVAGVDAAVAGGFSSAAIGDAASYNKATYKITAISEIPALIS